MSVTPASAPTAAGTAAAIATVPAGAPAASGAVRIVLFYHYFSAAHVLQSVQRDTLREFQERLCRECGLSGRVLVSTQGLNGTLGGTPRGIAAYETAMGAWVHPSAVGGAEGGGVGPDAKSHPFRAIDWKHSTAPALAGGAAFPDLIVKPVKELVASGGMPYQLHTTPPAGTRGEDGDGDVRGDAALGGNGSSNGEAAAPAAPAAAATADCGGGGDGGGGGGGGVAAAGATTAGGGGRHLSPEEFHAALLETAPEDLVVLDVRNRFEHAIGHFVDGSGRAAVDPNMRNFTQFKHFVDACPADTLRGKKVLMYCTGGIRCETASCYVRSKGLAAEVCQLSGGIHRYCERFGDRGLWRGKNFVFDRRVAVTAGDVVAAQGGEACVGAGERGGAVADGGPGASMEQHNLQPSVVGTCSECGSLFDELNGGVVCTVCVCLVLVCPNCRRDGVPMGGGLGAAQAVRGGDSCSTSSTSAPQDGLRRREWYCKEHAHLRGAFLTFLDGYDAEELTRQQGALQQLLKRVEAEDAETAAAAEPAISCGAGGGDAGPSPSADAGTGSQYTKRRRPQQSRRARSADPRQRALTLRRQLRRVGEQLQLVRGGGGMVASASDGTLPCRCCMQRGCPGNCWGIWKTAAVPRNQAVPVAAP